MKLGTMRNGITLAVALCLASITLAESVQLRTGQMLVGDVRLGESDAIVVEARYPEVRTVTLRRSDLTPESLFELLERRTDRKDAVKLRELAEVADKANLKGQAVAEYRAVKALDPAQAKEMDARITRLLGSIAADLLEDARDLLDQKNAHAAIMYLHTILEQYPGTDAAKSAEKMMNEAHAAAGGELEVSTRTASVKEAPKLLENVAKHLEKGDKQFTGVGAHEGSSVSEQRAAERAIGHYEDAWEAARDLPVTSGDPNLQARIDASRTQAKAALLKAYLTAGTIHIQRRSIRSAERYCNKACALDPENKVNHDLHRLIVQAKTLNQGVPVPGW